MTIRRFFIRNMTHVTRAFCREGHMVASTHATGTRTNEGRIVKDDSVGNRFFSTNDRK